jgi:fumarate reductase flavoprotein subunit
MNLEEKTKIIDLEAEVLVIGGGGAGLTAALVAVEKGATNVLILEKRLNVGGNSSRAMGICAAESPVQKQEFIEASKDTLFKIATKWHHWDRINPRILRAYIDKSGDTIRWLEKKGIEFSCGTRYRLNPTQIPIWHVPNGNIAQVIRVLTKNCEDAGIQILTRTCGKKILSHESGRVTGVLAMKDDKDFQIKAKTIIITTGGFIGNKELMKKYFPYWRDNIDYPGLRHTGDGLEMVAEVGGAIEDYATLIRQGPRVPGSRFLMSLVREPNTVWVNKKGERFIDESTGYNLFESGNAILRQPEMLSYTLFDDNMRHNIETNGLVLSFGTSDNRKAIPDFKEQLQIEQDRYNRVKISDSWDGIANWIGADIEVLKLAIEEYNSFCDQGYDKLFAKERRFLVPLRHAPYYAIRGELSITDTIGAIRINEHMEVLDKQDTPIPGLYAAGVCTSGWESDNYCSDLFGSACGFTLNSGRIAGENAAKFVLEE